MLEIIGILIIVVIISIIRTILKRDKVNESINQMVYRNIINKNFPYRLKSKGFMTKAEIDFYQQLEIANANKYYIIPQVKLDSILEVDYSKTKYHKTYLNKIDRKTFDFVLFTKPDFKFVKAIELNDYTHDRSNRKVRDEFVKSLMKEVGLELQVVDNRESFKPF